MAKTWKKTVAFLFFLLAGIILGSVIAQLCSGVPFLSWLSYGKTVGINTGAPMILDLVVFKIAFGFSMNVNVAQIFCVIISILIFSKTCKNL